MGSYLDWSGLWRHTLTKDASACHKCRMIYIEPEADDKLCCPKCGYYGAGINSIPHEILDAAARGLAAGKTAASPEAMQLATVVFVCLAHTSSVYIPAVVLDTGGVIRIRVGPTTTLVVDEDWMLVARISPVSTDIPEIWEVPNVATLCGLLEDA